MYDIDDGVIRRQIATTISKVGWQVFIETLNERRFEFADKDSVETR